LTLSHDALLELLAAEEPHGLPDTGTNIGDALAWGLTKLESAGDRRKVLILLSDGEHNVPAPALTPRQAGQLAANRGVPIYAIDAGPPPAPDSPPEEAEARAIGQRALQSVAALTGGKAFAAHDDVALVSAIAEIDRLEHRPVESFQYRRYAEAYPWCAAAALVCFVAALGLERTMWRRVP
jgi:Ca-activated chloride channel family protein